MADSTPIVAALARELIKARVIDEAHDRGGMPGVHLSWAPDELPPALVKTWRDPEDDRIHCEIRWKPSDT